MSDFSLTLVLQIKTSKIINDMAKVQIKSEKIIAFGGIFFVLDRFDRILSSVIDSHLGLRSKLIAYLENRDGNANVRFMQAETHRRFFEMMRSFGIHVRSFRADCGSYSEDIVKMVMEHTDKFYIRAERYAGLYEKVKRQTGWTTVEIGFQQYDVQSFPFESSLPLMAVLFGIKATDRVKSFPFRFIAVPAKWIRTARQYKLNIYSNKPYNIIWEHG